MSRFRGSRRVRARKGHNASARSRTGEELAEKLADVVSYKFSQHSDIKVYDGDGNLKQVLDKNEAKRCRVEVSERRRKGWWANTKNKVSKDTAKEMCKADKERTKALGGNNRTKITFPTG